MVTESDRGATEITITVPMPIVENVESHDAPYAHQRPISQPNSFSLESGSDEVIDRNASYCLHSSSRKLNGQRLKSSHNYEISSLEHSSAVYINAIDISIESFDNENHPNG